MRATGFNAMKPFLMICLLVPLAASVRADDYFSGNCKCSNPRGVLWVLHQPMDEDRR
jgi:hypothetical protein